MTPYSQVVLYIVKPNNGELISYYIYKKGKIQKQILLHTEFYFWIYLAERMRLERTMPCGTPHFQCGSLPLEYLSIFVVLLSDYVIIANLLSKIKWIFKYLSKYLQKKYILLPQWAKCRGESIETGGKIWYDIAK